MTGRFDQQTIWITGASSGIGRACALEFAREGARVVVSARRAERLEELVGEVGARGGEALAAPCDVTDEEQVEAAVAAAVARFGGLDGVLASAGYGASGRFEELELDVWRRQFEVNVFGLISTVRHALPALRESRGRIGLLASVAAFLYAPRSGPYSASKAAVRAIGETLSAELAGSGVSCTTLHPGFVRTEIGKIDRAGGFHDDWEDRRPANLLWDADAAARVIVRAMHRRRRECVFTGHGRFAVFAARHAPALTFAAIKASGGKAYKKG